ncbi:J domain-containing protein [Uliginosibacterium gangwonense]|uniref:J domain-containing protein n=1 Tax=Uliginosibacterium gangwonense TaxID=392736 RepID=UPI00035E03A2|nr:J domain-containing protein [Uliginosibacterium gangwonense]
MFKWLSSDRPAPEALELEEKLRQLEVVEERYAEVQTEYATLQNELSAFKLRYWRRVGPLYARLDELRAEIARELARSAPRNPIRQQAARVAGAQAKASAEALHEAEDDGNSEEFTTSEDLKRLYRQAARLVHPDRADDDEDRNLRDDIMARINAAYRNNNGLVIESLIEEYQMRAETGEEDAATRLIRTIRTIARMREQIREIEAATITLRESELYRLQKIVLEAEAKGTDKLSELARGVERQISEAQLRLDRIRKTAATAANTTDEPVPSARQSRRPPVEEAAPQPKDSAQPKPEPTEESAEEDDSHEIHRPALRYIAEQLYAMRLGYEYRQALDGASVRHLRVPDFTLHDGSGNTILWFHLPELDEIQRERWQADLAQYASLGYEMGINLFMTRDEENSRFDEIRLQKMARFIATLIGN